MKNILFALIVIGAAAARAQEIIQQDPIAVPLYNTPETEALSSQLMSAIAQKANGDRKKMADMLEEIDRDPASLEKYLTADQARQLEKAKQDLDNAKKARSQKPTGDAKDGGDDPSATKPRP